jgi:hypothetical protein
MDAPVNGPVQPKDPPAARHSAEPIPPWVEPEPEEPTRPRPPANRARPVPSPWIDCTACGWRHFPAMDHGAWRIVAERCSSCGAALAKPAREPEA